MNQDRQKSNITVSVIDLTGPLAQALEEFNAHRKEQGQEPAAKMDARDHGYVQTEKGMFVFCREGVGHSEPVTGTNKLEIDIYPEWNKSAAMMPAGQICLTDTEIMMLPTKSEESLEDFIRSFGRRLESNYSSWLHFLTKAKPMAATLG